MRSILFVAAFAFAAPAFAQEPGHGEPVEAGHGAGGHADGTDQHDEAGAGTHGGEPGHGDPAGEHGEAGAHGAGHHVSYTGDDDHDGTANFMDADSEGYSLGGVGQHLFNLLILAGILVYVARTPVRDALKNRSHDIRKEITEAARARDEARQRHDELSKRLAAFEDEVRRMKADAEADAKADEAKLVARARDEAARIGQTAERNIREEVTRARVALRKEAVDLAVMLAEQTLRGQVQGEDQRRLAADFLASINRDEVNGNG
jgi:F-type H+-transporting ATPase subunit b